LLLFLPLNPFTRQFEQLVQQQVPGLELEISKPHLLFPFGVGANQVTLSHPQVLHPPFQLQDLALRPLWLSLLSTNPGVSFDLETFGGQVSGSAYGDGVVQTTLNQLKFEESLEPQLPLTLSGELNGGEFAGQLPFAGKNQSQLQLELNNLKLSGMNKIGSGNDVLDLGRLSCTAEAKGPLVQISNLSVSGPAFDLKGNGNLRVGRTPANSSLNLSLVLTPKPGLDPMLNDLLSLTKKPQADGSYQFSLRGALTRLRFN
jgi:type II secretion system protein N